MSRPFSLVFVCSSRQARECWNWKKCVAWLDRSIHSRWRTPGKTPTRAWTVSAKPCRRSRPQRSGKKNRGRLHSNASGGQPTPQPDCPLQRSAHPHDPRLAFRFSANPGTAVPSRPGTSWSPLAPRSPWRKMPSQAPMALFDPGKKKASRMTNPSKRLLLFTAKLGYQTRSFEDAARKLGVQLVYVTDRCHQLEDPWGDQAIAVHFETPEVAAYTVREALRGQDVSGILALGDRPAAAAAYAARGLGVRYNHPAVVEACRSKLRMKEVFRDAGLSVPWFRDLPIDPASEPVLLVISYPCVLKPLSLSASQGVVRANNREEFLAAVARVRRLLKSPEILATREANLDQILVEGYIPGREVAIEGLLTDGALSILAAFDKPDPLEGPYFEETIYVAPSRLPESVQRAIEKCARDATRALGLSHGPIHAEFRVNEDGVWPLEVAPRPIGGPGARGRRFSLCWANVSCRRPGRLCCYG